MRIILTIKAILNFLYNNLIDLVWVKKIRFSNGAEMEDIPTSFDLFDIKTISERIATKGWSCISYPTQNKLSKTDVPTIYNLLKNKLDNADGAMSAITNVERGYNLPCCEYNGNFIFVDNSGNGINGIYKSANPDLSNPTLLNSSIPISNYGNCHIYKLILGSTTLFVFKNDDNNIYILDDNFVVKSVYTKPNSSAENISKNPTIFGTNDKGYVILKYNTDMYNYHLIILEISTDGSFVVKRTLSKAEGLFPNGINDDWNTYQSINSYAVYNNKLWWVGGDYVGCYDYINDVYTYDTSLGNGTGLSQIFIYENKLSLCKIGGYLYQLENGVWNLKKTFSNGATQFSAFTQHDDTYYFATNIGYIGAYIMSTKDFDNINLTDMTPQPSNQGIYTIIISDNNYVYRNINSGYQYSGYTLTVYTDTYTIDGNSVTVKYYKNGDFKLCTPDIDINNDTNLQTVYDFLGYLNYWWIDTANEEITLFRNSNLWSFMYVGDDYSKEFDEILSLPTGNATRLLPQSELIEIDTVSITLDVLKNKIYKFTSSAITDITFSSVEDSAIPTTIKFTTGNSAPTFTDNSGINWVDSTPVFQANKTYQIIIFDNDGYLKEF